MGSFFSSQLSSAMSASIFPAHSSSYDWNLHNLITIPKSNPNGSLKIIPAVHFGSLPVANNCDTQIYIIYSHGNAEDIGECYFWLKYLHEKLKVNILAYDYEGYGLHKGSSSENACYRDIKDVYDYLIHCGVKENNIILYGRSLGTGPTVELASTLYNLKGAILESPYTSIFSVVSPSLAKTSFCIDPFRNESKIDLINCPLLIIHGTKDEIIPYEHSQALQKKSECNLLTLKGGGHNDLQIYHKQSILKSIKSLIL